MSTLRFAPLLSGALFALAVVNGLAPTMLRVAIAFLTSSLLDGSGGNDGLVMAVAASLGLVAVAGLTHATISQVLAKRLTHSLQAAMIRSVNRPIGLESLTEPSTVADLSAAQGGLGSYFPAAAPGHLAAVASMRLDGLLSIALVAVLGHLGIALLLLLTWFAVKLAIRKRVLIAVQSMGGEAAGVARAQYFERVVTSGEHARELRLFAATPWLLDRFKRTWESAMKEAWRNLATLRSTALKYGLIVLAVNGLAYWWLLDAASADAVSLRDAVLLILTIPAASSLALLGESGVVLEFCVDSFPKTVDFSEEQPNGLPRSDGLSMLSTPSVRFDGVTFAYPGTENNVFTDLNLVVAGGRSTAIVGANGIGKSTIIKLIGRLYEPTKGQVLIGEQSLAELNPATWRRSIACVFQDSLRLPATLRDNVALGAAEGVLRHRARGEKL